jgi:zinc protease
VAIVFTGPFKYEQANRTAIRALGAVLDTRLRETLREALSGTYGVSASPSSWKVPVERYTFSISWGCDPKRNEELAKAVLAEIAALQTNGPTEKQVNDVREAFLRDFETNSKQNSYVLAQVYQRYLNGEDVNGWFRLPEEYKKIDAAMIHEAARQYLRVDNYVQVTLLPEK